MLLYLILLVGVASSTYFVSAYFNFDLKEATSIKLLDVENDASENVVETNLQYYSNKEDGIYAVFIDNPYKLSFYSQAESEVFTDVETIAGLQNSDFVINAGYFLESFAHAGLLKINGEIITNLAENDYQLTHLLDFTNNVQILSQEQYLENETSILDSFQTGPLLISQNEIQTDLIQNSANGNGRYRRSIIGVTNSGKLFFVATKKSYSLEELGEEILKFDELKNETFDVLNLDGGSSVAFYSEENEDFRFSETSKLPYLILVQKN